VLVAAGPGVSVSGTGTQQRAFKNFMQENLV